MSTARPFTVALPKKGRLKTSFNTLFEEAGYALRQKSDRHDFAAVQDITNPENRTFGAVLQKAEDALLNLQDGLVDAAITGRDKYEEIKASAHSSGTRFNGTIAAEFNFSACRMMIAAPHTQIFRTPADLSGKTIATSYPATLLRWLQSEDINTNDINIITRSGGIEDYIRLGAADAICDIVDTGRSLQENGLTPCFTLYRSAAVLVTNNAALYQEEKRQLRQRLEKTARRLFPAQQAPFGHGNDNNDSKRKKQEALGTLISSTGNNFSAP